MYDYRLFTSLVFGNKSVRIFFFSSLLWLSLSLLSIQLLFIRYLFDADGYMCTERKRTVLVCSNAEFVDWFSVKIYILCRSIKHLTVINGQEAMMLTNVPSYFIFTSNISIDDFCNIWKLFAVLKIK